MSVTSLDSDLEKTAQHLEEVANHVRTGVTSSLAIVHMDKNKDAVSVCIANNADESGRMVLELMTTVVQLCMGRELSNE